MGLTFKCRSLDFTFDAYNMYNPSPTYPNGAIIYNTETNFMEASNGMCTKFNLKGLADSLTTQYGSGQTEHVEKFHIMTYEEKTLHEGSYNESQYQNVRYVKSYIQCTTIPGNDPRTNVRIVQEKSNTLDPWNPDYTISSSDFVLRPSDVLLSPGAGELILVLKYPWEDYDGQSGYVKEYSLVLLYNVNQLQYRNAPIVDYPDYRTYENSYTVEVLDNLSGIDLSYVYNRNVQTNYITAIIDGTFVDEAHFFNALRAVEEAGGDSGGEVTVTSDNPDDDTSDGGGGSDDGDYSQSDGGDEVDFSEDPGLDGLSTGFVKVYAPDTTQMQALSQYMLSSAFIDNVKKLYANPMDYILGLKILPFKPGISGSEEVTVGGVSTNVYMSKVSSRWKNIDCGSVNVIERFGGYMDYAPYTKIAIYLPFIGVKELNTDEVTGTKNNVGKVTVKYKVDVVTGECIAEIKCKNKKGLNAVCYAFNGNCATDVPITQRDTSKILSGFVGGVSAAAVTGISAMSGNVAGMVGGSIAGLTSIMQSKPTYAHSGNFSGSSGFLGRYKPFLIIESPIQSLSSNFVAQRGYPSNVGKTIGDFDGFTSFNSVRLHDIYSFTLDGQGNKTISSAATQDEIAEIREILKEGVYL